MVQTNVMRLLDQKKVPYRTAEYHVDESDLSGVHAAAELGMDPAMVFKTLVAKGEKKGYCVFCIPVAKELNLKKCAAAIGDKKIEMLPLKNLTAVTGYIRGGCSPVGMKKKYKTVISEDIILRDTVCVSGGKIGIQLEIAPEDLCRAADATYADIVF